MATDVAPGDAMASGHSATASSTCTTGRPPAYSEGACVLRSLPACSTLASSVTARSPAVRLMTVSDLHFVVTIPYIIDNELYNAYPF